MAATVSNANNCTAMTNTSKSIQKCSHHASTIMPTTNPLKHENYDGQKIGFTESFNPIWLHLNHTFNSSIYHHHHSKSHVKSIQGDTI